MTDKIEIQGKTVDEAVSEALLQMGARRDEVDITVLEEPKGGLFGFLGGRPARVVVRRRRSRGRGGRSRNDGYQAHSLSDGPKGERSRGDSRRGGGGRGRAGARTERNEEAPREVREARPERSQEDGEQRPPSRRRRGRRGGRGRGGGGDRNRDGDNRRVQTRQDEGGQAAPADSNRGRDEGRPDTRREARPDGRGPGRDESRDQTGDGERTSRRRRGRRGGRGRRRGGADQPRTSGEVNGNLVTNENVEVNGNLRAPGEERYEDRRPDPRRSERRPAAQAPAQEPVRETAEKPQAAPAAATPDTRPDTTPDTKPAAVADQAPEAAPAVAGRRAPAAAVDGDTTVAEGIKALSYAQPVRDVADADIDQALTDLASGVLVRAGFPCRCQVHDGEYRQVRIVTDDSSAGMLIGRQGQTVDAIEHIVERMASAAMGDRVRMNLDVNNYRRRREDTLQDRVADAMAHVQQTGEEAHMETMDARDRRLVHLEVAEVDGLCTWTEADSEGKHVVIGVDDGTDRSTDNQPVEVTVAEAAADDADVDVEIVEMEATPPENMVGGSEEPAEHEADGVEFASHEPVVDTVEQAVNTEDETVEPAVAADDDEDAHRRERPGADA